MNFLQRTTTMTKTLVLPGLLALGFALCLVAQSEADYAGLMKDVAATKGKVTKGIAAKQNTDVATDATHLARLFKQGAAFWAGRKSVTPRRLRRMRETAANELPPPQKPAMRRKCVFITSRQLLGDCHMAHREGTPEIKN